MCTRGEIQLVDSETVNCPPFEFQILNVGHQWRGRANMMQQLFFSQGNGKYWQPAYHGPAACQHRTLGDEWVAIDL